MTIPSASAVSVFISYSSKDRSFVLPLAQDLKAKGFTIWLDVWNIKGRQPYWQEIEAGVESCTHCLFVISPDSIEDGCGARDELAHAKHKKKKLVVIMAKAVDYNSLPIEITPGRYQIHDFTRLTYAEGLHRVADALIDAPTPPAIPVVAPVPAPTPKQQPKPFDWVKWGVIATVFAAFLTAFATIIVPFIERALDNQPTVFPITPTTQIAAAATNTLQIMPTPLPFDTPIPPTATNTVPPTMTPVPPTATNTAALSPEQIALTPQTSNIAWQPYITERDFAGVPMMLVPAGSFQMGSTADEIEAGFQMCQQAADNNAECPRSWFEDEAQNGDNTQTFATPFWIDKFEVTRAQYQQCVDEGNCTAPPSSDYSTQPDQPINRVTWLQAKTYCEWRGMRLPTEREWEYAARGPDRWQFPWGNTFTGTEANHCDKNCGESDWASSYNFVNQENDDGYAVTAPVGSYPQGASWVGALDMAGNVWEWTGSWYTGYPYDKDDGREDLADSSSNSDYTFRGLRGGSFNFSTFNLRAANRGRLYPDDVNLGIGFRCARSE